MKRTQAKYVEDPSLFCPSRVKPAPGPPASPVKGLPLRSDKRENHAPLTARTARRLAPLGRAFAFYAPLCASPLRSKDPNQRKEFFRGNNLANNLLSSWVRSSQHRALWPRLRRQGNSRGSSSRATSTASGEICPTRTGRKTTTA